MSILSPNNIASGVIQLFPVQPLGPQRNREFTRRSKPESSWRKAGRRILNLGQDDVLLRVRDELLRQAGFEVISGDGRSYPVDPLWPDLVVLCHSLSFPRAQQLAKAFRDIRGEQVKLLLLLKPSRDFDVSAIDESFDATLSVTDGPRALLQTVERLCRNPRENVL
jgi:hypothetical protein